MKIILVCESSYKFESGGRVVRYITQFLNENGHEVKLVVLSEERDDMKLDSFYEENDVKFFPLKMNLKNRLLMLFFKTKQRRGFINILSDFNPDIVHFASFDNRKPPMFIADAKKFGAKIILQPWTMQFFCAQGFGFRDGSICTLCANGSFLNSLKHKCINYKHLPTLLEKFYSRKVAQKADVILSSNLALDSILSEYGIVEKNIRRFPIAFDYSKLEKKQEVEEDYFVFYGQANSHKGLNVLIKVFKSLPNIKLKICPLSPLSPKTILSDNIEVINDLSWINGLKEVIEKAKAVLIPSLWSTSTEYSLCEALQLKKPVVVFNVGVHKDIFVNNFNALVIEPDDIDGFKKAVEQLDKDEDLRNKLKINGYNTLLELNNSKKLYSELFKSYRS